jgi:peptide-methionine (S)-S-oxide reductase
MTLFTTGRFASALRPNAKVLAGLAVVLSLVLVWFRAPTAGAAAQVVPPPTLDASTSATDREVAVLAGGCFWGVQGVFQHVNGVTNAVSGYAGGAERTAQYEIVGTGTTNHAESVQITFDPREVTFGQLLQIYFSVAHDPTQLNRQGPDYGSQYRSTIFPTSAAQARVAEAYIAQLDAAHVFASKIVTTVESGRAFYPAEDYHQDFLTLHPTHGYIVVNDLPKVADLERLFPARYRKDPVLVRTAATH